MKITLKVMSRFECPVRVPPDYEQCGPPGPVATCNHPKRQQRGGDPWCPHEPNQRADDLWVTHKRPLSPFPPRCPLRENEVIER